MSCTKTCPCGKEFIGARNSVYCPECRAEQRNKGYKSKVGEHRYQRRKMIYDIWVASKGTGLIRLSDWAYRDKNGKICVYKRQIKLKPTHQLLRLYRRDDDNLPEDVLEFFEKNKALSKVLRYEGSPEEMQEAVREISEMRESVDLFLQKSPPEQQEAKKNYIGIKTYLITSPSGEKYEVNNLGKWAFENAEQFGMEPTESNVVKICNGLRKAAQGAKNGSHIRISYKQWKCESK